MMGLGWLGMIGMGLGMLLFWILLILLAVVFIRLLFPSGTRSIHEAGRKELPLQILNERYARGEITRQQYELMKADLSVSKEKERKI